MIFARPDKLTIMLEGTNGNLLPFLIATKDSEGIYTIKTDYMPDDQRYKQKDLCNIIEDSAVGIFGRPMQDGEANAKPS
jgi:hypothetical protein